jgi:hypothetical protein
LLQVLWVAPPSWVQRSHRARSALPYSAGSALADFNILIEGEERYENCFVSQYSGSP